MKPARLAESRGIVYLDSGFGDLVKTEALGPIHLVKLVRLADRVEVIAPKFQILSLETKVFDGRELGAVVIHLDRVYSWYALCQQFCQQFLRSL